MITGKTMIKCSILMVDQEGHLFFFLENIYKPLLIQVGGSRGSLKSK